MAKRKPNTSTPFTGRWRIVSMSAGEQDFIDEEEEGYIEFSEKDNGEFHFGYVHGQMDCRLTTRDGEASGRVDVGWQRRDGPSTGPGLGNHQR